MTSGIIIIKQNNNSDTANIIGNVENKKLFSNGHNNEVETFIINNIKISNNYIFFILLIILLIMILL